jgi:hypothetical protein
MFCWQPVVGKVIANYSNKPAFTIHKNLLKKSSGGVSFVATKQHKNTIFYSRLR